MRTSTEAALPPLARPAAPDLTQTAQPIRAILIALTAGALNVFAFAPFGFWLLQLACTAVLFVLVMRASDIRRAAVLGWLYSFAWTCAGVHWLYISLHDLGGMPAWLTVLAIALLALGLGLIVGAATAGTRWLQQRWRASNAQTLLLILPALWMLSEWTRGWIFTGFPWLSTGYAHAAAPLAGYAALIGVYGISGVAAVIAAALALLALQRRDARKNRRAALLPMLLVLLPLGAGQALRGINWTQPHGNPITVRLLQGNIAQEMKFDDAMLGANLDLYQSMITRAPADLIAIPETALPVLIQQLPADYLPRLTSFVNASGSTLLLGMPISDGPTQYSNGLIVLAPALASGTPAALPYRYDKHHLVPFGEFIPPGFRWFVDTMRIPLGDQTRGAAVQAPFAVKDQWIMPNICYEDLFGEEIAVQIRDRSARSLPAPTMMLNISNIAWFGNSIAVPQHLQISQMRTLETGRPMLRSTNTGATAIIDPHGRIQAQLPPFSRGTLAASVQGYDGMTPFIRFGNGSMVMLAGVMLLAAFALARRRATQC